MIGGGSYTIFYEDRPQEARHSDGVWSYGPDWAKVMLIRVVLACPHFPRSRDKRALNMNPKP